jgi:hypothetical protein
MFKKFVKLNFVNFQKSPVKILTYTVCEQLIYRIFIYSYLFVHRLNEPCNIGQVNYSLYVTKQHNIIWTSNQCNIANNNTKFKGQLDVESVTTGINVCKDNDEVAHELLVTTVLQRVYILLTCSK